MEGCCPLLTLEREERRRPNVEVENEGGVCLTSTGERFSPTQRGELNKCSPKKNGSTQGKALRIIIMSLPPGVPQRQKPRADE